MIVSVFSKAFLEIDLFQKQLVMGLRAAMLN